MGYTNEDLIRMFGGFDDGSSQYRNSQIPDWAQPMPQGNGVPLRSYGGNGSTVWTQEGPTGNSLNYILNDANSRGTVSTVPSTYKQDSQDLNTMFEGAIAGGDINKAARLAVTPQQRALLDAAYGQFANEREQRGKQAQADEQRNSLRDMLTQQADTLSNSRDSGERARGAQLLQSTAGLIQQPAPAQGNMVQDYRAMQQQQIDRQRMDEDRKLKNAQTVAQTGEINSKSELQKNQSLALLTKPDGPKPQLVDGQWVYPPDENGVPKAMPVPGFQNNKPLTESQGKAAGIGARAQVAHEILTKLEAGGTLTPGLLKQAAESVPLMGNGLGQLVNSLPTFAGGPSSDQQRVEQAQRDFVNAALRVESGASISNSEFDNARKQYFPQPGDSKAQVQQKQENRAREIQSLSIQAGRGSEYIKAAASPAVPSYTDADIKHTALKYGISEADVKQKLGIK